MKISIITCMKNEGPFIVEWVAYNRLIGVTDFLIYTNDCTDGTVTLLDALAASGIVQRVDNPAKEGQAFQMVALKAAPSERVVKSADWIYVCDVDEFLDIRVGAGRIEDLVTLCGDPHAISVTMRMMANGGIAHYQDRPVIDQFTRSHDPEQWVHHTAIEVKTLTRADFPLKFFGAHRPFVKAGHDRGQSPVIWTDGSGRQVPDAFIDVTTNRRKHRFPAKGASNFASLNHYTLRSLDSYLVKSERGDVNRAFRAFQTDYWMARNDDSFSETRLQRRVPELLVEMEKLFNLPGVRTAHKDCVSVHKQTAERLKRTPEYGDLRKQLFAASPALQG